MSSSHPDSFFASMVLLTAESFCITTVSIRPAAASDRRKNRRRFKPASLIDHGVRMADPNVKPIDAVKLGAIFVQSRTGLWPLIGYFLKLGAIGFGGPVALVGFMHRDLVESRGWISEDTYKLSLALAQIMPGPLAAQTAIAIGYFEGGILGATLVGLAFVLPSFLMVLGISFAYVAYGGLWWMQAAFYGIGAMVIA